MKIQSIAELFEVYDFVKENCRADPLLKDIKILRRWMMEAALIKAIHILRNESRIYAVAFFWPTYEIPVKKEVPFYREDGEILWCQYCYASESKRGKGKIMLQFLEEALVDFPTINQLAYRRTKKNDRIFIWPLKGRIQEPIEAELEEATNG